MDDSEMRKLVHEFKEAIRDGAREISEQLENIDTSLSCMNDCLEQILENLANLDDDGDDAQEATGVENDDDETS